MTNNRFKLPEVGDNVFALQLLPTEHNKCEHCGHIRKSDTVKWTIIETQVWKVIVERSTVANDLVKVFTNKGFVYLYKSSDAEKLTDYDEVKKIGYKYFTECYPDHTFVKT